MRVPPYLRTLSLNGDLLAEDRRDDRGEIEVRCAALHGPLQAFAGRVRFGKIDAGGLRRLIDQPHVLGREAEFEGRGVAVPFHVRPLSGDDGPDRSPVASPFGPNSTPSSAWGVATIVIATSTPAAAPAGVDAATAPCSTSGAVRPGVRFQTVTACPAWSRRAAIGVPIWPRPRNAIFDITAALLPG